MTAAYPELPGAGPTGQVLSTRALNRALLERQLLTRRHDLPVVEVVERIVGLQAQHPLAPYFGLWTRLTRFRPDELAALLLARSMVRIALMRSTIHLVTVRDCVGLRPVMQPALERDLHRGAFRSRLGDVDIDKVAAAARTILEQEPRTNKELADRLAAELPGRDPATMCCVARCTLPLVQVPPRGIWGRSGAARHTTMDAWLGGGCPLPALSVEDAIVRYLRAFGPATAADIQTWSGIVGLREAIERLRPVLRTSHDKRGKELLDVPDAPLPDEDMTVPVRYLAEFDNVLLSHSDRSRIVGDEHRGRVVTVNGLVKATVLVNGFVRGIWRIERKGKAATLVVEAFAPLSKRDTGRLSAEGIRLLAFAAPAASHDVRFTAAY